MIVWGGSSAWLAGPFDIIGGIYDPATDTWAPTTTVAAPSGRFWHTAVWTGSKMIVWGSGDTERNTDTGGLYDPTTDSWAPTSTAGAPSPRFAHTSVWTGTKMVVWGGDKNPPSDIGNPMYVPSLTDTGGVYDPATDSWRPTSASAAPSRATATPYPGRAPR